MYASLRKWLSHDPPPSRQVWSDDRGVYQDQDPAPPGMVPWERINIVHAFFGGYLPELYLVIGENDEKPAFVVSEDSASFGGIIRRLAERLPNFPPPEHWDQGLTDEYRCIYRRPVRQS